MREIWTLQPKLEHYRGKRARRLLDEAERHLQAGEYGEARRTAEWAKKLAIDAREAAQSGEQ